MRGRSQARRAVGNEPDAREGELEKRVARGEQRVAHQREAEAEAHGRAVHRDDHRHLESAQPAHHRIVDVAQDAAEIVLLENVVRARRREIGAGAEAPARPRHDQRAKRFLLRLDVVERLRDAAHHARRDRVQRLRIVEAQDRDTIDRLHRDVIELGYRAHARLRAS